MGRAGLVRSYTHAHISALIFNNGSPTSPVHYSLQTWFAKLEQDGVSLVSATWLRQVVNGLKNIRILDASWTMSGEGRAAFLGERLAGAQHFDIDEVSEQSSPYPHMIPSPHRFQTLVAKLFGHERVSVLDGGLRRWKFHWFPTVSGEPHTPEATNFTASFNPHFLRNYEQMLDNHTSRHKQVVDARSSARFKGDVPEPRPSLPSGGMKGAVNLHYSRLLDAQWGTVKTRSLLASEFQRSEVDLTQPVVATCGSGVTAAIIALAAHSLNT
ncbi:3-mercaptopyruvate sulfurtransferase, partial [Geodia barretti]